MSVEQTSISNLQTQQQQLVNPKASQQAAALSTLTSINTDDKVSVGMDEVYKSLTILGDKIVSKLNELMKKELPEGIQSLKPEDQTAEKTADRIVSGVVGLLPAFAAQNKNLEGEELISKFMEVVKGGIKEGYEDAIKILEGLGAMEFGGVQSGIEETMKLVGEKLDAFAAQLIGSKEEDEPKEEEDSEVKAEVVVE